MALWDAIKTLSLPAVYFLLLGLLLKRSQFFADLKRVWKQSELNLKLLAFDTIFILPVIGLIAGALDSVINGMGLSLFPSDIWVTFPTAVTIIVAVMAGDFIGYWRHRLEHTALLWPSHAVHHSDTEMTWLTLVRFHPVNRFTTFVIDSTFLMMLGLPPFAVIANNLVKHYYGFFIHADLPWTYGPLGKVFVSPAMHRWHHAKHPDYFQTNFATVFSLYDRVFGTFRVPGPCTSELGVTDDMAPTLWGQLSYAFKPRAYRRLARRIWPASRTTEPGE